MSEYISPVYNVQAIPVEKIKANDYNPNRVAPPEMKLLELSIWEDGYTQPIVCYHDKEKDEISAENNHDVERVEYHGYAGNELRLVLDISVAEVFVIVAQGLQSRVGSHAVVPFPGIPIVAQSGYGGASLLHLLLCRGGYDAVAGKIGCGITSL